MERPRDSQVVIQRNLYSVRVLGRGARSKNKRQYPPACPSGSSTNVSATRFRYMERQTETTQSIYTRDDVAHITNCCWQLKYPRLHRKKAKVGSRSKAVDFDIIGVSSTKRRSLGTVDLDG